MKWFNFKKKDEDFVPELQEKKNEQNLKINESDELSELRELKAKIDSCRNPQLVKNAIDWLSVADRAVVITTNSDGTWTYDKSDKEFDPDFLNRCKDIIRDDVFEKLGQEEYANRLDTYEPDLANAFREMEYYAARASYYEAYLEYHKAINNVNSGTSHDFSKMWSDVTEKEKIMLQLQGELLN